MAKAKGIQEQFETEVAKKLQGELKISNALRAPKPTAAYIQIGIGKAIIHSPENKKKILEDSTWALTQVTGQKPKLIVAKKSVAGFKLREGQPVALLVTLRKKRLFDFLDRLLTYVLPREKDFRGLGENNFDKVGNINFGLKEIGIFPEAISDKIKVNFGLQITVTGSGKTKDQNLLLWEYLGFPMNKDLEKETTGHAKHK